MSESIGDDDVGDVAATQRQPDDADRKHKTGEERAACCDLLVTFAKNEVGVTLVQLPPSLHVRIRAHVDAFSKFRFRSLAARAVNFVLVGNQEAAGCVPSVVAMVVVA